MLTNFNRNTNRAMMVRGAMAIGKYAYANRKAIAKAAARLRFTRNTRRKFKARPISKARKFIGSPITRRSVPVHTITVNQDIILDSRVLYSTDTSTIGQGAGENQRTRDILDLAGIRLNMVGNVRSASLPTYYNVAIVLNKDQREVGAAGFFRGYVDRQQDFTASLSAVDYAQCPINADKFAILMHARFKLAPATSASSNTLTSDSHFALKRYLPIKRRLTYGSTDIVPELADQRIFIVQWCCLYNDTTASPSIIDIMRVQQRVHYYFRNDTHN